MPFMTLRLVMTGTVCLFAFSSAGIKTVAVVKFLRVGRNAWGWGLTAGIVGCVALWCSIGCVLPLAAGIYTIVILCQAHVRNYLKSGPQTAGGAFPVAAP